mgnify:CR=1 FL=1
MDDPGTYYINKERMLKTNGAQIKIMVNEQDFKKVQSRTPIATDEATSWIKRCIVGNIRKDELDDERLEETNNMDMFCN